MLPILVARQITEGLQTFLRKTFPVTTSGFRRDANRTLIDDFLDHKGNLSKGPWLEVKLPFRTAGADTALPFSRYTISFQPYQHQLTAFQRLSGSAARSSVTLRPCRP